MIDAKIIYKDGTSENRTFSTWLAYAKFINDHASTIKEANLGDMHPIFRKESKK